MKTVFYILVALALFTACSGDDMLSPAANQEDKNLTTFKAYTPATGETQTRTVLDDSLDILWRDSDWISVIGANGSGVVENSPCFLASGSGTTNGTFRGEAPQQTDGYYATYPCNDDNTIEYNATEKSYTLHYVWNGQTQAVDTNSFDPDKALMYAHINSVDEPFQFKNICAYLKFKVNYKCKSVVITSTDGTPLVCNSMTVAVDDNGNPTITSTEGGANSVTVTGANGSDLMADKYYYVAVLPDTLKSGFSMKFTSAVKSDKTYTKSTSKGVRLKRNTVLNLGNIDIEGGVYVIPGSGTADDPYLISDSKDLHYAARWLDDGVSGFQTAHYKLTADIDCDGQPVCPFGGSSSSNDWSYAFSGTFDGCNHTISNYRAGIANLDDSGLFGEVKGGTIKNLKLDCVGINFNNLMDGFKHSFSPFIAVVDGSSTTTIQNCHVTTSLDSLKLYMADFTLRYGNLIATANAPIEMINCSSSVNTYIDHVVMGENDKEVCAGGLIGLMYSDDGVARLNMNGCRNTGKFTVENKGEAIAGGILGRAWDNDLGDVICYLMNCVNKGNVSVNITGQTGENTGYAGGIIGYNDSDGRILVDDPKIFNCLNTGNVYGCQKTVYAGGIIGWCDDDDTDVYNCASTGTVSGKSTDTQQIGALCGNDQGSYWYCRWTCGLSITYNGDAGNSNTCSRPSDITYDIMNEHRSDCTSQNSDFTYFLWKGSSSASTLDLVF